jgi:ATP-dependent Clp protease ATP-binding subunit ClpB
LRSSCDVPTRSGFHPHLRAWSVKRAIQRLIQDPLAIKLLDGDVLAGETMEVDTDLKKGEMKFGPEVVKAREKALG